MPLNTKSLFFTIVPQNVFQDSLESLPGDLRRNFTLMHDLDVKNKNILREVDSASDEYLRKVRELSPGK